MIPIKLDPTFYPSPKLAMKAPREKLAYVACLYEGTGVDKNDFIAVIDVDEKSPTYSKIIGKVEMPYKGDELHHFGWNAVVSSFR